MTYAAAFIFGYLLGSIPFGLVLCKLFGYGDVRKIGSGNIGATNVLRTGNKLLALATLILDSGKGAIAVLVVSIFLVQPEYGTGIGSCLNPETKIWERCGLPVKSSENSLLIPLLAGLGALIGHCYPIWLKFKGGKGVATTLGTLLVAVPLVGVIACAIWLLMASIFRISSLAALIAIGLTPIISHTLYQDSSISLICAVIAVLVYFKHHENIKRILTGKEPKIGKKKKEQKK